MTNFEVPPQAKDFPEELHIAFQQWIRVLFETKANKIKMLRYHTDIDRKEIKILKEKMK